MERPARNSVEKPSPEPQVPGPRRGLSSGSDFDKKKFNPTGHNIFSNHSNFNYIIIFPKF